MRKTSSGHLVRSEREYRRQSAQQHLARRRGGLKPAKGWHKRNFLTEVLIPSLFTRRFGKHLEALFPDLDNGEVGITWGKRRRLDNIKNQEKA